MMKLKIFQLAAILNLFCIAAFFAVVIYFASLSSARVEVLGLIIFVAIAVISVVRDLVALQYVRICLHQWHYNGKYKVIYIIAAVIVALTTCLLVYGLYQSLKQINLLHQERMIIIWHLILVFYMASNIVLAVLDFFILPQLEKLKDPSAGMLEDFPA